MKHPIDPDYMKLTNADSKLVFIVNDNVRAIELQWDNEQDTSIAKTFDTSIEPGDVVVVETDHKNGVYMRNGTTTATVKAVDVNIDFDDNKRRINWIIAKVDIEGLRNFQKDELALVDRARQAQLTAKRQKLREQFTRHNAEIFDGLVLASPSDENVVED